MPKDPADEAVEQRPFSLPPDATEIIVVRHGASAAIRPGETFELVEGRGDPPLSEVGVTQAARVAERLADEPVAGIFVTPLQRTSQTAAPLASALKLEPVVVPELVEVHLGDWDGGEYRRRFNSGDPLVGEIFARQRWDVIPNAESMEALEARVKAGLAKIVEATGPGRSVVAVLHGGVIGEICRQATGSRGFAFVHADNCSITRVVVFPGGHLLLRCFNDIAHLS